MFILYFSSSGNTFEDMLIRNWRVVRGKRRRRSRRKRRRGGFKGS